MVSEPKPIQHIALVLCRVKLLISFNRNLVPLYCYLNFINNGLKLQFDCAVEAPVYIDSCRGNR